MDYPSDNSSLLKSLQMVRVPGMELSPDHEAAAEIVQRALTGDSLAFEQLIARYERRVMTVSLRILGTREDAHDAAQEVFLRVFKYLHRLDPRKPIEPWLMRMTINVCRDIGRKRKHHQSSCPDLTDVDSIAIARDQDQGPHEEFAEQQRRNLVRKALDCLSEGERIAIVLRDVEGLPTSEVAEILQAPEATVRSRIRSEER